MTSFNEMPYERPDFEAFKKQLTFLIADFKQATSAEEQIRIMEEINNARNEFDSLGTLVSIRNSIDTANEFYDNEKNYWDEIGPLVTDIITEYYIALANSQFRLDLEAKWGKQLFRIAELSAKCFSPDIIEDLQQENALCTEYQKLLASAKIMFDGEERNLAGMTPYLQSTDRVTRISANKAKWEFFTEHREQLDSIYDKLVHLRHDMAVRLGFKNFVELGYARMLRSDYDSNMVSRYRDSVLKYIVPVTQELRKRQAHRLDVEKLAFYDESLQFKSGNPTPKGGPEWIVEQAKVMYSEMSPETNEFFSFLCEHQLMDLINRPTKAGGGYCTMINKYKAPFIFSNFNGTAHDVDVLTHEAGHAFQGYMSRNLGVNEYYFPTYEACEIHSMSMEFFAWKWIKSFFKEDEDKYQFTHLSGALLFLPYGVTVDEFQHWVYENPTATPAERRSMWLTIEKKYMPHRDYSGFEYLEQGGIWQQQRHIYESPFYYIDYTLAQICALQFWVRTKTDMEGAWKDYVRLCSAGGSQSFLELVEYANLHSPFEEESFTSIIEDINTRLSGVPDEHFA